jgi:hypothetical protein
MNNNKPLWQVMANAYHSTVHDFDNVPHAYAAELRAIANRIRANHKLSPGIIAVGARQVAEELDSEAERAEVGE